MSDKFKEFDLIKISENDGVILDIRYATSDNFTNTQIYTEPNCYLHKEAALKLYRAIENADALGFTIKIFDAFRPKEAQFKLWEHTPNEDFLAHPEKGSPHSRGVAVDLTLIHGDGNELDMGTSFDDFSISSNHGEIEDISVEAQINRYILLGIMSTAGWDFYKNEWWHYQLFDSKKYPLIGDAEAETGIM